MSTPDLSLLPLKPGDQLWRRLSDGILVAARLNVIAVGQNLAPKAGGTFTLTAGSFDLHLYYSIVQIQTSSEHRQDLRNLLARVVFSSEL